MTMTCLARKVARYRDTLVVCDTICVAIRSQIMKMVAHNLSEDLNRVSADVEKFRRMRIIMDSNVS